MDYCKIVKFINEILIGEICLNLFFFLKIIFFCLRKCLNIEKNMNGNIFLIYFKVKLYIVLVCKWYLKFYIYYVMLMLCGVINFW